MVLGKQCFLKAMLLFPKKRGRFKAYHSIMAQSLLDPYRRKPELGDGSSSGVLHVPLASASALGNSVGNLGSLYALVALLRGSSMLHTKSPLVSG